MTSIQYDDIFNSFLGNVADYEFATFSPSDASEIMTEWLHKSIAQPYVRRLFSKLEFDDNIQMLTFEMSHKVDDETDKEFVVAMLGKQMVCEWIQPMVKSTTNLMQFFGGKDQNYFSQSSHIAQLRGIKDDVDLEVRRMIRDRAYIWNGYVEGSL